LLHFRVDGGLLERDPGAAAGLQHDPEPAEAVEDGHEEQHHGPDDRHARKILEQSRGLWTLLRFIFLLK
jgi:hypothetical protein